MQALAKWLKVDPRWLRYGGVLEDSFISDYMSLSEEDKATVRAVVMKFWLCLPSPLSGEEFSLPCEKQPKRQSLL